MTRYYLFPEIIGIYSSWGIILRLNKYIGFACTHDSNELNNFDSFNKDISSWNKVCNIA